MVIPFASSLASRCIPVLFNYTDGNVRHMPSDKTFIGLVAQDVRPIFPEAVSQGPDGYLELDMQPVNIALINAVKELNSTIEATKHENKKLRSELDELKALVSTLVANQAGQGNK